MNDDWDSICESREQNEQEAATKMQNDQYWQQLERGAGYDD